MPGTHSWASSLSLIGEQHPPKRGSVGNSAADDALGEQVTARSAGS